MIKIKVRSEKEQCVVQFRDISTGRSVFCVKDSSII